MKQLNLAATLIFGLATPLLVQTIAPMSAAASDRQDTSYISRGSYADREWVITIRNEGHGYEYSGYHKRTRRSIQLSGGTVSEGGGRIVYTWNNSGTIYQVTYQPRDPDYVRLRVKTPSGEVLNRLLREVP